MYLLVIALVLALCIGPVMIGAHLVGAKRRDVVACFGALVVALLLGTVVASHVHLGVPSLNLGIAVIRLKDVLVLLLAALVYMLVLGTTYWRGLAVAAIQFVLTLALVALLASTAIGPTLRHVLR